MATAKQIIDLALSQMRVAEVGETNNVKYNTEYYGHTVHDPDPTTGEYVYPWCVVFVWWVFRHANCFQPLCGGEKPHTQVMSMILSKVRKSLSLS